MFADSAKVFIRSGKGGDGHVSFRRELYVAAGGPDGGDGGKGGDVIFEVEDGLNTLTDFRHVRKYAAQDGESGGKRRCHGADGDNIIIKVPEGTVIKDFESGKVIADMSGSNRREVILKGGKGGLGNMHFATSTMQVPKYAQPGQPAVPVGCPGGRDLSAPAVLLPAPAGGGLCGLRRHGGPVPGQLSEHQHGAAAGDGPGHREHFRFHAHRHRTRGHHRLRRAGDGPGRRDLSGDGQPVYDHRQRPGNRQQRQRLHHRQFGGPGKEGPLQQTGGPGPSASRGGHRRLSDHRQRVQPDGQPHWQQRHPGQSHRLGL